MDSKEGIYELQKIDCNCNNCGYMERDFEKYQKWEKWHRGIELADFEKQKEKAIESAKAIEDEKQRAADLRIANKMQFQFNKAKLLHYGNCLKFQKPISFIPNICQIETQDCFVHRKDI